jgi:hypothetical protein
LTEYRSGEHSTCEHCIALLPQGPQAHQSQDFPLFSGAADLEAEVRSAIGVSLAFKKMNLADFALIFAIFTIYT